MITVDVIPAENNIFLVRFSEPDEFFKDKVYIPVYGMDEVKRRMYFKNRMYILTTISGWIKQRQYSSVAGNYQQHNMLLAWLSEYRNASFFKLCGFLKCKRKDFESIAPGTQSKFYNHYIKTIVPIFDYAELEEDNQR